MPMPREDSWLAQSTSAAWRRPDSSLLKPRAMASRAEAGARRELPREESGSSRGSAPAPAAAAAKAGWEPRDQGNAPWHQMRPGTGSRKAAACRLIECAALGCPHQQVQAELLQPLCSPL